jgi:hypothetical protein
MWHVLLNFSLGAAYALLVAGMLPGMLCVGVAG